MRSKFNVTGLASAATIWTLGAIGMLIGWGHIPVALGFTVVIFFLLRLIPKLEHILFKQQFCLHMDLTLEKTRIDQFLEFFLENQISLSSTRISSKGDRAVVSIHQCGVDNKAKVLNSLRQIKGIFSISDHPVT